jgi:beta-lactamase regulating signal transducer with metallopeptidase domain
MWISMDTLRPLGELLVAWMLTYALHSSLLVLMASVTTWWLRRRHLSVQETAWKLALLGGLATASLQIGLGITPLTGSWALGLESPATELAAPAAAIPSSKLPSPAPRTVVEPPVEATPTIALGTAPAATQPSPPVAWTVAVGGSWLGVGIVLCLLLGLSYLRLAYRLRDRTEISSGRLPRVLARLLAGIARPIRMTTTHRLRIPIAKGVIRREICLPRRVLNDLTPEQQETLLAHEAAHLLHRDPFWLALARFVESLFFFQPLNRLARRRMQEISEFRCDDWTVERTGRPLTLARCLTEVAGWNVGSAAMVPAPGMAQDTSGLGSRVRRLLDREYPQPREKQPRWLQPVLAAVLLVVVVSAPGISLAGGEEEPPPRPPVVPEGPIAEADGMPAPPAPPKTVAPVVVAAPTPVAVLAPVSVVAPTLAAAAAPVVAPNPAASPAPAPAPRLALAAAPAMPVSSSSAVPAAQEVVEKDDEAEETAREREVDELVEEIEEALEEIEDEIDEELESVEEEIEEALEEVEEPYEEQLESYEEEFDEQLDEIDEELDALEDRVDEKLDIHDSERQEEAFERDMDNFEDQAERRLERFEDELERIEDRYDERIDATIHSAIEGHLEAELEALEQRLEGHQSELERLAHDAAHKARSQGLSDEEIDQLRAEAQRIAAEARPSAAEMAEMKAQLRRAGEEAKRAVAQAEIDSADLEAALEAWRADYRVELEKLRAELESLMKKYN